ncbi:TrbC/VirB2 family protein [Sphingorhabdus soli]|uniref:TrbC/VirB2 family protein n=1 Tax=Flavisphingopyxis soli TaxID=2601267 RepID=A0A5C6ULL0_9SPHN|nr:TrbC/VirB2 family protein [Sphingorhabdus soli]TXC73384.1 TrbC/VirB2 family protein [Sphingorhabdus soli]
MRIALTQSTSLSDPSGSTALVSAARWIGDVMLGPLATVVAVIAIALVGFAMLSGRIDWRRGLMAVAGCFLLFGAPAIVAGLLGSREWSGGGAVVATAPATEPIAKPLPENYDPYAGASLIR